MQSKLLLLCLTAFVIGPWTAAAQNVAVKATCKAEPAPNYSVTSKKNTAANLIDGKYSKADFMWLDPLTPGWQHVPEITLDFMLDRSYPVGSVTLNTMTNAAAGIALPLTIHVFTSEDGKSFKYQGDMMENQAAGDTKYKKVKCSLKGINVKAEYLRLVVIPSGALFFADEVEVLTTADKSVKETPSRIMNAAEIDTFLKGNEKASRNRKFLGLQVNKELAHSDAPQEKLLKTLSNRISSDGQMEEQSRYEYYLREIAQTRVEGRSASGKFILNMLSSPWSADLDNAPGNYTSASGKIATEMLTYTGGTEYFAFSVMNDDINEAKAVVNWDRRGSPELRLYTAEQVKTRDLTLVRDALRPLENGHSLSFYPGEIKIIIAAVNAEKAGTYREAIRFKSKAGEAGADLTVKVLNTGPQPETPLNVNVWAYFNTPFLNKRKKSARNDLMNHYVNTVVIPPQFALPAIICGDIQPLKDYLEPLKGFQNVLLFLNFRGYMTEDENYFLSDQWKECFLAGYDEVLQLLEQKGVDPGNVYLYPFDEIRSNELGKYIEFASWIRSERENALLYATVSRENIMARMNGHADICQLLDRKAVLEDAGKYRDPQYWIYDIMDRSKSISPYSRYRLMAWKAFSHDFQGIGFWAYGDIRGDGDLSSAWNDFDGNTADRAAVYEQGDAVIPSRRWEAFKQGIDDYTLLGIYARKFGEKEAKALCDVVLSKPQDVGEAGRIRKQILQKLAGN